ncbi:hypothetical protein RBU49_01600 [Clostridium sp. MB40-C1]|uniref:hypothetical protein n=1 Tax=Clostridium sp. MB40-C1 TaxID=3070996 RepID=UPI0027E144ED|nr:hypothetical protein [Clostridium sp. MB40-C1]WMJ80973.1 hypothetical protein RBU49_01600 [Clostridium sp. MB40-C1]
MDFRIEFYKKTGGNNVYSEPVILGKNDVISINIDRRLYNTGVCSVSLNNTSNKIYQVYDLNPEKETSPYDNHSLIKVYIENKIQFVGIIRSYRYLEESNTFEFEAHDYSYKLMKNIDTKTSAYLTFTNMKALDIVKSLILHSGVKNVEISKEMRAKDYLIKKMEVEYNSVYSNVIDKIINPMYGRFRCKKDGTIVIENAYPIYNSGDDIGDYNFKVSTKSHSFKKNLIGLSDGNYTRDSTSLCNKLVVRGSKGETDYKVFECPYLKEYLNGEIFIDEIQEELAVTTEQKRNAVNKHFRSLMRKAKTFDFTTVKGNPDLEIGNVIRVEMANSKIQGSTLLNGITTNITEGNYTNTLETEILVNDDWFFGVEVGGNYTRKE